VSAIWRCGVCETVNSGGRLCRACGSELSLTAVASRSAKAVVAPALPPVTAQQPLPDTVNRAINREEITDEEWHAYDEGGGASHQRASAARWLPVQCWSAALVDVVTLLAR